MNKTISIIYFDTEVNLIDAIFLTFPPCLVQRCSDNAELHCRSCHGEAEVFGSWVGGQLELLAPGKAWEAAWDCGVNALAGCFC